METSDLKVRMLFLTALQEEALRSFTHYIPLVEKTSRPFLMILTSSYLPGNY